MYLVKITKCRLLMNTIVLGGDCLLKQNFNFLFCFVFLSFSLITPLSRGDTVLTPFIFLLRKEPWNRYVLPH